MHRDSKLSMIKFTSKLLTILLFIAGCEKSETYTIELHGTLKGKVRAMDVFGNEKDRHDNILVEMEGSEPLINTTTDSAGYYELNDIPMGTYNLIFSKEGYGEVQQQGFMFVGGEEPNYFNTNIYEISSLIIENLSAEFTNDYYIHIQGTLSNNYTDEELQNNNLYIRLYFHNSENLSYQNYLTRTGTVLGDIQGTEIDELLRISENSFPSSSQVYLVAYGAAYPEKGYYDIHSNTIQYTTFGPPSNIASFNIP